MPLSPQGADVAAFLAKIVRLANSNIQFEAKVVNLLSLAAWQLGLERALLMHLDRKTKELVLFPPIDDPDAPKEAVPLSDTVMGRAVQNRQPLLADAGDLPKLPQAWQDYLAPYVSCLALVPILDDKTCYGLLILLSAADADLSSGPNGLVVEAAAN